MKHLLTAALAALTLIPSLAGAQRTKPAAFAGQFYDADAGALAARVDGYLAAAKAAAPQGRIAAIIVPHAGYVYSGPTAAFAYALVRGRDYDTVVIIGPSHQLGFEGCSIYPDGGFETPLGTAPVDAGLAREISKASGFGFEPEAFAKEHSVEVQVPFVQRALPGAKIVPIVMGFQTKPTIRSLADGLIKACAGKKVLVVASTDLSHFLSQKDASSTDAKTISLVQALKTDTLIRLVESGANVMCGGGPVAAALLYAQKPGPARVEVLRRADSTEAGGPEDRVVGYAAAAVFTGTSEPAPAAAQEFALTAENKAALLKLARAAVTEYVSRGAVVDFETKEACFLEPRGVFVTLKKRGGLRGCIGFIEPVAPLAKAVVQCAIYASTEDPRFPPVREAELKDLEVELSVLTPFKETTNPALVRVGTHGLIIERGGRRGVLLPQVPVENGWDRETFLNEACLKAGLPSDAWKKGAKIFTFEAIVFHETP
jgi:AmmeMemoRadiSam system protein B/AmmeMemoRadiSam system protein A